MNLEQLQMGNYEPAISQVKSHRRNLLAQIPKSSTHSKAALESMTPMSGVPCRNLLFSFFFFFLVDKHDFQNLSSLIGD